ncbi:aspartate aminotransferase [hydrocarbon metagenome]|uniref:Aspartate aminotransferase n=1 Tax=hydrocarbon metagenome TaxID=938273 RepID=A0A0W8G9V0_9ZZZZ
MNLPPFELERYFAVHEFTAKRLLCVSDCQPLTVAELLSLSDGAAEAFAALPLGYADSRGGPTLRQAICPLYASVTPDDLLVHVGAEEAIFTFFAAVVSPGDRVIVQTPCYRSLRDVPASLGASVLEWPGRQEEAWIPDLDFLKKALREKTRAVVVNFPHNPTGALPGQDIFREIVRLCDAAGALLFSDEVYRHLEYDPADRLPAACDLSDSAVSLGVMSKSFGLAGLRVGWVATKNVPVLSGMARIKDYTSICGSPATEFLATLALNHREDVLARTRTITLDNLAAAREFMARRADRLTWAAPKAGPIAFPRLADGGDAADFANRLLEATGALLLPGRVYGPYASHFRLGFGRTGFIEGLAVLDAFLDGRASSSS